MGQFNHQRTATNKNRQLWQARFNIADDRVSGQLLDNKALVRDFKNIKVTEGIFKVDIGTGSGVKITFKI